MSKTDEEKFARDFLSRMPFSGAVQGLHPREEPDFEVVLSDGPRRVGLEVTELKIEHQAAGAAVTNRLCEDARRALLAEEPSAVGVILEIPARHAGMRLSRQRHTELVGLVVRFVRSRLPVIGGYAAYDAPALEAAGIEEVTWVMVVEGDETRVGHATNGPGVGPGFIDQCIVKKNARVAQYRANMPGAEQWLLLVAGASAASAIMSDMVRVRTLPSAFDRTFYIDYFDNATFEVNTKPA